MATIRFNRPEAMNALDVDQDGAARGPARIGSRSGGALRRADRSRSRVLRRSGSARARRPAGRSGTRAGLVHGARALQPDRRGAARNAEAGDRRRERGRRRRGRLDRVPGRPAAGERGRRASTWRSPGSGLSCDTGSSWTLPRLVGTDRPPSICCSGAHDLGRGVLELGLATEVVPDEEFEARVPTVARELAAGPTLAYAAIRQSVAYRRRRGRWPTRWRSRRR